MVIESKDNKNSWLCEKCGEGEYYHTDDMPDDEGECEKCGHRIKGKASE